MTQATPSTAPAPKEWSTWSTMPSFGQPIVHMDLYAAPDGSMLYYVIVHEGDAPGLYACCRQDSSAQFTPIDDKGTTWWWKVIGGNVSWAKAETTKDGHVAWCLLTNGKDQKGPQDVHVAVVPQVTPGFTFDGPNSPKQVNNGWTARPMQIDSTRRDDGLAAFLLTEMTADVNVVDRSPGLSVIQEDNTGNFKEQFVNGSGEASPDAASFCNDLFGNLTVLGLKNSRVALATTQQGDGTFLENAFSSQEINASFDRLAHYYDQVLDLSHKPSIRLSGPFIFVDYKARLSFLTFQDDHSVSYYRAETPFAGFPFADARFEAAVDPTYRKVAFDGSGSVGATTFFTSLDTSKKTHAGNKSWLDLAVTYAATSDSVGRCFFCQITHDGVIQTGYQGNGPTDSFELKFEKNPVPLPGEAKAQRCVPGVNALGQIALFAMDTTGKMYASERLTALGPAGRSLLDSRSNANESLIAIANLLKLSPEDLTIFSEPDRGQVDTVLPGVTNLGDRLKNSGLNQLTEKLIDIAENDVHALIDLLGDLANAGKDDAKSLKDRVLDLLKALPAAAKKDGKSVLEGLMDHHVEMNEFGKVFETIGNDVLSLATSAVSDVENLVERKGDKDHLTTLIASFQRSADAIFEIQNRKLPGLPMPIDRDQLDKALAFLKDSVSTAEKVHPLGPLAELLQKHLPDPTILDRLADAAASLKDPSNEAKADRVLKLAAAKSAAEIVSSVLKVANESFPTRVKFGVNLGIAGKIAARGVLEGDVGVGGGLGIEANIPVAGVGAYGGGAGGNRSIIKVKAIGLAITPMVIGPMIALLDSGVALLDLALGELS